MAPITEAIRHRVVFEYERCNNITGVARNLKLDRKTVRRWVRRFQTTHSMANKPGQGRKKAMNPRVAQEAVAMLLSDKYAGCQEVAKELYKSGKTHGAHPLHRTTLLRHAKAAAIESGQPICAVMRAPAKELTQDTISKRLAFCQSNALTNWSTVMFTDRQKFFFYYPGTSVKKVSWVRKGQRRVAKKVNHAMCVNMYAGITKFGVTKPHFVAGTSKKDTKFTNKKGQPAKNITANEYKHVVADTFLKEGQRLFGSQGITTWVLQQDNDPTHKKAATAASEEWNRAHPGNSVYLLQCWPPNSPDLSPIENVWAYVQHHANVAGCATFDIFQAKVMEIFQNLPAVMLRNLYKSMKDRVATCIELSGGKTKY